MEKWKTYSESRDKRGLKQEIQGFSQTLVTYEVLVRKTDPYVKESKAVTNENCENRENGNTEKCGRWTVPEKGLNGGAGELSAGNAGLSGTLYSNC